MYLDHFQLAAKPFQITSDPRFLWLGEKHKEALATLRYGILDNRGFLLLTGEVGTGKTLLINRLMTILDQDTIVATLPDPDLDPMDFFNLLAIGFKMNRTFDSKGAFLIHLRDFLYQSHASHKQVLLIIDECQRLPYELMEMVRILSNIELQDRKLINIFLVGQQEVESVLSAPQNRALAQRITVRYHLTPLEPKEIAQYIFHRLRVAGGTRKIFTPAAISQITCFSGGIPRLINILCDHALLTAYARGSKNVDSEMILECAEELRIPLLPTRGSGAVPAPADSKSIADATARNARADAPKAGPGEDLPPERLYKRELQPRPIIIRTLLYIAAVSALMLLAGLAVVRFSSGERALHTGTSSRSENVLPGADPSGLKSPENGMKIVPNGPNAVLPDSSPIDEIMEAEVTGARSVPAEEAIPPVHSRQVLSGSGEEPPAFNPGQKLVIRFTLNSSEIESDAFGALDRLAVFLVQNPAEHIRVLGHTDSSGSPGYNESMSRFRASVVKSFLVGKGVSGDQITLLAAGDTQPMASNATAEGRHLNRRVEIEIARTP